MKKAVVSISNFMKSIRDYLSVLGETKKTAYFAEVSFCFKAILVLYCVHEDALKYNETIPRFLVCQIDGVPLNPRNYETFN